MKSSTFLPVTIVLAILLALSAGLSAAQGPAPQDAGPLQTMLGSAFTYQGQLQKDGTLVNDTCTMVFSLYDDATAGSQQGDPITLTVTVADGLFTAVLDSNGEFGTDAFTGEARWLEVAVQCPGDASFNTLTPRQALTAAPYALSLRPGALVEGDIDGHVLRAINQGEGGGVYGQCYGTSNAHGVTGLASATSGTTYGVYGRSSSPDGYGVFGWNGADNGAAAGVHGRSDSTSGVGVYGLATDTTGGVTIGVSGQADSPEGTGVFGNATASTGVNYGVWGQSSSTAGVGVYGYNEQGLAVVGSSTESTAITGVSEHGIGIYGESFTDIPLKLHVWSGDYLIVATEGFSGTRFMVTSSGDVYADGDYHSPAPGFAEMLPGTDGLEAGDVLVVGPDGALARCDTAYQPTVVGVYAPQAGFVSGKSADTAGQVPLAVMGVVTVKVSAENGPIVPGDLLVAAATPGHAMRAGDNPVLGTVIGKALGSLDKDTGTLLMLVMLR